MAASCRVSWSCECVCESETIREEITFLFSDSPFAVGNASPSRHSLSRSLDHRCSLSLEEGPCKCGWAVLFTTGYIITDNV